jgi:membrane fusion protein (multidrug efflux system)
MQRALGDRARALIESDLGKRARALARNRVFLFAAGPVVLLIAGLVYFLLNAGIVATDDAAVAAARVAISPEVRGRIIAVEVHDNQQVQAGDVLLRIDDADYATAVANAEAGLASARLRVSALRAELNEARAQLGAARETEAHARREGTRQNELFRAGVSSRRDADAAQHEADLSAQQARAAAGALAAAQANVGAAARTDQHPLVREAQAELDQARSQLEDTVIRAPRAGVVAHVDQIQIGSFTQPGQALFWLVAGEPWVNAAFKEDQLEHLRPGQPVRIHIDAFGGRQFHGHVVSLSPGTGSTFSVLPSQNASGNWVKVVQRLNVRIAFDDVPPGVNLADGLSATVRVDTRQSGQAEAPQLRGREN